MGKLFNSLQAQLKIEEYKQDAEDCLKIYDKLIEMYDGHIWESNWYPLVDNSFIGQYPNCKRISKLTYLGKLMLKDITIN